MKKYQLDFDKPSKKKSKTKKAPAPPYKPTPVELVSAAMAICRSHQIKCEPQNRDKFLFEALDWFTAADEIIKGRKPLPITSPLQVDPNPPPAP